MKTLINQLKAARDCSTPLLAVTTPDQPAVARAIVEALNGDNPVVAWDRVNGFLPRNQKGKAALQTLCDKAEIDPKELPMVTCEAHSAFRHAANLPAHTVVIAFSLNRFLHEEKSAETIQAVLNLRDLYKGDQRTLIGLSPDFVLPIEIQHDVILLDDPLPEDADYGTIIKELYEGAELKKPEAEIVSAGVRSVRGLSSFEAEQVLAMAIASTGMKRLDLTSAWKLKQGAVSKVRGLTMTLDGPDLSDLRGLDNAVEMLNALWDGPEPPELVMRVDEMDKSFAGLGSNGGPGDNTGITQDFHQQFLTNMEDNEWIGALLFGVRGGGKTVLSQAIGKAHNVPTIAWDMGQMKQSHVGESESNIRDAFRTVRSIGGKRVLVLATCNKMDVFPAELLRRFKLGVLYFDLLSKEERDALWPIYLKKYGHDLKSPRPNDEGWTGAEIRNCCELAYKLRKTIMEVGSKMIVPATKSDPKGVERLRDQAENRYLSAAYPGTYRKAMLEVPDFGGGRKLKGAN
jgi:ATPase family associated with various cellular activities (AAA)